MYIRTSRSTISNKNIVLIFNFICIEPFSIFFHSVILIILVIIFVSILLLTLLATKFILLILTELTLVIVQTIKSIKNNTFLKVDNYVSFIFILHQ